MEIYLPYFSLILLILSSLLVSRFIREPFTASTKRIGYIDGLRGYLALAVVAAHFPYSFEFADSGKWEAPDIFMFKSLGSIAVSTFFMITGTLFYTRVVLRPGRIDWFQLYRARLYRLCPAYFLSVLGVLTIAIFMSGRPLMMDINNVKAFISWIMFTLPGPRKINDYLGTSVAVAGVTWTLCYEWIFYFGLPIVAATSRRIGQSHKRIAIITLAIVISYISPEASLWDFSSHLGAIFLFGMLTAEIIRLERMRLLFAGKIGGLISILALAGCLFVENYSVAQIILVFLFYLPVAIGNGLWRWLNRPATIGLGDASYSIYLFHGLVLFVVSQIMVVYYGQKLEPRIWLLLPVSGAITVAFSVLIYRALEKPFMDLGKAQNTARRPESAG